MQFNNQTTRNVADIAAKILSGETISEEPNGEPSRKALALRKWNC
jgi:hypothetical protein